MEKIIECASPGPVLRCEVAAKQKIHLPAGYAVNGQHEKLNCYDLLLRLALARHRSRFYRTPPVTMPIGTIAFQTRDLPMALLLIYWTM